MKNQKAVWELTQPNHYFDGKKSSHVEIKLSSLEDYNGKTDLFGIGEYHDSGLGTAGRLAVMCYVSALNSGESVRSWGWRIENRVDSHLTLADSEKITNQLRKIEKALLAREKKDGPADTFGAWALRIMQALGCPVLIERVPETDSQYPFRTWENGAVVLRINRTIENIISESEKTENAA